MRQPARVAVFIGVAQMYVWHVRRQHLVQGRPGHDSVVTTKDDESVPGTPLIMVLCCISWATWACIHSVAVWLMQEIYPTGIIGQPRREPTARDKSARTVTTKPNAKSF